MRVEKNITINLSPVEEAAVRTITNLLGSLVTNHNVKCNETNIACINCPFEDLCDTMELFKGE